MRLYTIVLQQASKHHPIFCKSVTHCDLAWHLGMFVGTPNQIFMRILHPCHLRSLGSDADIEKKLYVVSIVVIDAWFDVILKKMPWPFFSMLRSNEISLGFPILHLFYFLGVWGKWGIYFLFLGVPWGFEETTFSWTLRIWKTKRVQNWRSNWIIVSFKLIHCQFSFWLLFNSITEYYRVNIPNFELKNWSILLLISMILLPGDPKEKLMRKGNFRETIFWSLGFD